MFTSVGSVVGEWHSHPEGVGSDPSNDDRKAFGWLSEIMTSEGLPPLMLIVGEQHKFYLEKMEIASSYSR